MRGIIKTLNGPSFRKVAAGIFSVAVFLLALWVLHRTLGRFDIHQVVATAKGYPAGTLVAALLLALGSYLALGGFDWLGLHHVGRPVPAGWTMLISFVSHAVSHNAGFAVLTGGSVRLRMYSTFGLGMAEVGGVIAFAGLSFALGVAALASIAFIAEGSRVAPLLRLPVGLITGLGILLAAILVLYFAWTALAKRSVAVGMWRLATPSVPLAIGQILVAAADLGLVAGTLYLLLPLSGTGLSYPAFIGIYVVSTIAGTISHVPGGLGVFEGALVLLLPGIPAESILAALLVFRVFYNLLPLVLAALVLAVFELVQRRRHAPEQEWVAGLGPALAALLVFGCGAVLLVTGAVSPPAGLPDWLAEPAHLLSGAVAAILLVLSWALLRQADWSHRLAMPALGLGAVLALMRGPDWLTAAFLAGSAAVLAAAGPLFRRGEEHWDTLPLGWLGAAGAVVAGAAWLTWHGDTQALHVLSFATDDEGARAMRSNLMAVLALATAAWEARPATVKTRSEPPGRWGVGPK
ncbi:MAG: lysylphosphatidylglycerol synthetase family protein [Rhodospirillaceae bacterium]|nr:lysylphosphatidylglycerol synthetase family protein [Rhodospirillales bacterium]